jgi:hypothetical protein
LYPFLPPRGLVQACITGNALAINISSNWGWYRQVMNRKFFRITFITWASRTDIIVHIFWLSDQRPSFLTHMALVDSEFHCFMKCFMLSLANVLSHNWTTVEFCLVTVFKYLDLTTRSWNTTLLWMIFCGIRLFWKCCQSLNVYTQCLYNDQTDVPSQETIVANPLSGCWSLQHSFDLSALLQYCQFRQQY